eukprot:2663733-Ditylum_brightwellii.AAC.1
MDSGGGFCSESLLLSFLHGIVEASKCDFIWKDLLGGKDMDYRFTTYRVSRFCILEGFVGNNSNDNVILGEYLIKEGCEIVVPLFLGLKSKDS